MVTASSLGLAARALYGKDPAMPMLTDAEVSAGLAAPAAAAALLGKSGAAAMIILLYLAVTSATSAQLIAVSSVLTFDVYKPYLRPSASSRELFLVSHAGVAFWSIMLGVLGVIFQAIGISMGWLYTFMGIIIAPAVFPVFACLTWNKANRMGALVGMISGLALGITAWLVTAHAQLGQLSISSTGADNPLVAGNVVSITVPTIVTVVWSLIAPENYTFEGTRSINAPGTATPSEKRPARTPSGEDDSETQSQSSKEKAGISEAAPTLEKGLASTPVKDGVAGGVPTMDATDVDDEFVHVRRAGLDPEALRKAVRTAQNVAIPLTFILIIFVPCMTIIPRTFSPAGLGAWVGICIGWLFCSAFIVVLLPIWESRETLGQIGSGIFKSLTGRAGRAAP